MGWKGKCVNDAVFLSISRLRGVEIVSVEGTEENLRRVYRCCLARREGGRGDAVLWPRVLSRQGTAAEKSSIERSLKAAGGSACWCLGLLPAG